MRLALSLATSLALVAASGTAVFAQQTSRAPSIHFRVGGAMFTQLVEQNVREVRDTSIGAVRTISAQQKPAPVITAAISAALRPRVFGEASVSYARSTLNGQDDFSEWDGSSITVINALLGLRHQRWESVSIDGGIGVTRLSGDAGLFARGNTLRPLAEAGLTVHVRSRIPLQVIVHAQTHTFTTGALQDEGGEVGQVWRGVVQLGTTFGPNR